MIIIYTILIFISFIIGIYIGLKLPFISDKLGKQIIREYENKTIDSANVISADIINEWQNGESGDNNE